MARAVGVPAGAKGHRDLTLSVLGIDGDQFIIVFYVDVRSALTVGDGKFRTAVQADHAYQLPALGIDHRAAMRISIHGKNTFRYRIVNSAVGVVIGLASPITLRVFRSKMTTLPCPPSVMNPRPNSAATATPWSCSKPVILPTASPLSASRTLISVPCDR